MDPTTRHCHAVGLALAHLHLAGAKFRGRLHNRRDLAWWRQAARAVHRFLKPGGVVLVTVDMLRNLPASASLAGGPGSPVPGSDDRRVRRTMRRTPGPDHLGT